MLTSGPTTGVSNAFNLPNPAVNTGFAERFSTYATKAMVGAGVQSVVYGTPLSETIQSALVSSLAQTLTSEIGDWGQGNETLAAKTVAHAVVQCAAASVQGADCGSAALGAAVAEILSPLLDKVDNRTNEADFQQNMGSSIAGMGAVLAALLTGQDVSTALQAAQMVDGYNRQLHQSEVQKAKELAKKSGGKYTQEEIEDAMRTAGNTDMDESIVAGLVVDIEQRDAIYDKGAVWVVGQGGKLVQVLPAEPSAELKAYIQANTGETYSWYTPSTHSAMMSIAPRDPLTNLPLDDKNRYSRTVVVNGEFYEPKFYSCATTECMVGGHNLDSTDPATQAYIKALDQKIYKERWLRETGHPVK